MTWPDPLWPGWCASPRRSTVSTVRTVGDAGRHPDDPPVTAHRGPIRERALAAPAGRPVRAGHQPGHRRADRAGRPGRPRRRGRGGPGRRRGARPVGVRHGLRAGARPAPRRRRLPAAARRAGPGAHPRPGQAAAGRGLSGSRRPDRLLARRGRGRAAPGRRDPAQPTAGGPGSHRAPPARRGRRHHPVELAVHDAGPGHRARPGSRQHGRVDSRTDYVGLQRGAHGRDRRRGLAARGGRLPARARARRRR